MMSLQIKPGIIVSLDPEDAVWASSRPWHRGDTGYAKCAAGGTGKAPLKMHRLVLERMLGRPLTSLEVGDHINGDPLDNRRSNLRVASLSQNGMNRNKRYGISSYQGVGRCADGRIKCWMAYVNLEGQRYYVGKYYTEEEAAWMRDQWAIVLHGEFASLNFDYLPVETQA